MQLPAGLAFAVDWKSDFLGKESLLRQKEAGIRRRLATFVMDDPAVQLWGNEPVFRDGKLVGYTTSAAFSPTLGRSIAMAYVRNSDNSPVQLKELRWSSYEISSDGMRFSANFHIGAPHKG